MQLAPISPKAAVQLIAGWKGFLQSKGQNKDREEKLAKAKDALLAIF